MPILIIQLPTHRQAGTLKGRVLIGRWVDNTVVIDDNAVSRIHAWIALRDGRYYIADAGSRTGTFVNDQVLCERHVLTDGDQIRIGPAVLEYRQTLPLPADASEIDLSPRVPSELSGKTGILMECVCGAPLWLPTNFQGEGQCRFCGHVATHGVRPPPMPAQRKGIAALKPPPIPALRPASAAMYPRAATSFQSRSENGNGVVAEGGKSNATPPPPLPSRRMPIVPAARPMARDPGPAIPPIPTPSSVAPLRPAPSSMPAIPAIPKGKTSANGKTKKDQVCGICHAPITVFDEVTSCPSCGLGFHADCWKENHGCSAYGCSHVGAVA